MAASAWVLCLGPDGLTHSLMAGLQSDPGWPEGLGLNLLSLPVVVAPEAEPAVGRLQACVDAAGPPLSVLLLSPQAKATCPITLAWRQALAQLNWPHAVLTGDTLQQGLLALQVVRHAMARAQRLPEADQAPRWRWVCTDCDDGDCEQDWLPGAGVVSPDAGRDHEP
jgi:hypothetical protein